MVLVRKYLYLVTILYNVQTFAYENSTKVYLIIAIYGWAPNMWNEYAVMLCGKKKTYKDNERVYAYTMDESPRQ
jgi:hypothetical protein